MFTNYLYIKIFKDAFELLTLDDKQALSRHTPVNAFTTTRLLVGNFREAEACLRDAIASALGKKTLFSSLVVLVHPMEMVEGGLSEVEERIFQELCLGTGARKVKLHLGNVLSADQALDSLKNK